MTGIRSAIGIEDEKLLSKMALFLTDIAKARPPVTGEEGREAVKVMEMIVKKLKEKYGSREPA